MRRKILEKLRETNKISLIALIISLIASSPVTSRFLIYYLYEPKIIICFGSPFDEKRTFNMSEILESALNILNNDMERNVYVQIEFIASKPIKMNPGFEKYFIS